MKRYEKVIFSSIGVLYVVFMLFSFICLDRTDTVHYYPALTVRTDFPEAYERHCISYGGKVYYYNDSLIVRHGIYVYEDGKSEFLFNSGKVFSFAGYDNIIAFITNKNIFFYNCDSDSITKVSDAYISAICESFENYGNFYEKHNYLYSDENGIYVSGYDYETQKYYSFRVYPEISQNKEVYAYPVKAEHDIKVYDGKFYDGLFIPNPDSPDENVFLSPDDERLSGGYVKKYNDKGVCMSFSGAWYSKSIESKKSSVIIADFDKSEAKVVFNSGEKQLLVYADDEKCIYYDYNKSALFTYHYSSGESEFFRECKLKNFMNYYIERANDDTLVLFGGCYGIKDVIKLN